jgi:hypothetical protein
MAHEPNTFFMFDKEGYKFVSWVMNEGIMNFFLGCNLRVADDNSMKRRKKMYELWQRDSLGIEIWSQEVVRQKLEYVHAIPVSGKWQRMIFLTIIHQ